MVAALSASPQPRDIAIARRAADLRDALGGLVGGLLERPADIDGYLNPPRGRGQPGELWVVEDGEPARIAGTFTASQAPVPRVFTLEEYVAAGIMTGRRCARLEAAVTGEASGDGQPENIVVVGGTGAGKTTLLNALREAVRCLRPADRIALSEGTREVRLMSSDVVSIRTGPRLPEQGASRRILHMLPRRKARRSPPHPHRFLGSQESAMRCLAIFAGCALVALATAGCAHRHGRIDPARSTLLGIGAGAATFGLGSAILRDQQCGHSRRYG